MSLVAAVAMVLGIVGTSAIPAAASTTGTTVDGSEFEYIGTDKTSNGQITLTNATIGTTYSLYKIFDATHSGNEDAVAYTIKHSSTATDDLYSKLKSDGTEYFTISDTADADGNYSVTRAGTTTNGTFTPTKTDAELITYVKGLNTSLFTYIGAIKSTTNGSIAWKNIPYGYYYIKPDQPETNAVVTINSATPQRQIIDKNLKPTFDKNIVETNNSTESLTKTNSAGLDENVDFRITVNAKNYDGEEKIFKYVIGDTLDAGWTITTLPTVKITQQTNSESTATTSDLASTTYTIKYYTDSNKTAEITDTTSTTELAKIQYFEISVNWTQDGTESGNLLYVPNSTLNVDYAAKLDSTKSLENKVSVGNTPNKNTADVKYYKGDDEDDNPSGDLPDVNTETYTTEITIYKEDASGTRLKMQNSNSLQLTALQLH